ncbi:large subunit ribosomal protein L24e [Enteropsectra breve]|nr:large subunit ribosomal protein L24e [Enteropsectra breve]
MRIHKCWFCSANIYPGHGTTYVRNDSTVFRFCRSKCHKLFKRRLNPRKVEWTRICRKLKNKELVDDPIMKFERRTHVPVMYSKELVDSTVNAIPKILAVRQKREDIFIKNRILASKEESKQRDLAFIEKHKRLLERQEEAAEDAKTIKEYKKSQMEVEYN